VIKLDGRFNRDLKLHYFLCSFLSHFYFFIFCFDDPACGWQVSFVVLVNFLLLIFCIDASPSSMCLSKKEPCLPAGRQKKTPTNDYIPFVGLFPDLAFALL
jgi:hypothetical protein